MLIRYTTFDGVKDRTPHGKIEHWDILQGRLARHQVQPAKPDGKQGAGGLWSPTVYAPGETRSASGVELVTCFVADVDDGTDWAELLPRWSGLVWALHSSFSSTTELPKWRAVFPLKKAVPAEQWAAVWRKLNRELMDGHCDPATKDPSRIYFWPSCREGSEGEAFVHTHGNEEDTFLDHTVFTDPEPVKTTPRTRQTTPAVATPGELSSAKLLEKYIGLARPGARNRTAFDLACQLRDNAFSAGEALALLEDFKSAMGADFDDDMSHVWDQANNRSPRLPWSTSSFRASQSVNSPQPLHSTSGRVDPETGEAEKAASHLTDKWTDLGNKDRFLRHFAGMLRFDPTRGWMIWDGMRWGQDVDGGQVLGFASMAARSLYDEEEPVDEKQCQLWRQFVKASNQIGKIKAVIELAKGDDRVRVYPGAWDADPWVINCQNGILDLKTGELREHDPLAYCTYVVRARYDKKATAPLWTACMQTWQPDEEQRGYLQRHAGYNLTGTTGEQVVAFHFGDGGNGKSIYTSMQEFVMGDYATRVPFAVLTDDKPRGGQASPDIARLAGRRLVIGSEIIGGRGFNESLIKDLTGGDVIIARHLHAAPFEFLPQFKLTLYGNHKPQIRNQDEGIWRRLPLIEWGVTIPQELRDKQLLTKLQAEVDGIFAWMVAGCLAWQESGLAAPEAVLESSASYREEQDQIGKFIRECCVVVEGAWCSTKELRAAYDGWCEENGERWSASPNQFAERLRRAGATTAPVKKVNGKAVRGWDGIGLVADTEEFAMAEPQSATQRAKVTPEKAPLPLKVTPVTPVTPESLYAHTRARTHTQNIESDVTGVTGVTRVTETLPGELPDVSSPSPSALPKAPDPPADRESLSAVRAWEKELIAWFRLIVASGAVETTSPAQVALWEELEVEYKRLSGLPVEEARAHAPSLKKRMLGVALWWQSLETFPKPGELTKKGRGPQ